MRAVKACHCRSNRLVRYFFISLCVLALPASAQVYKHLDDHGTTHYSNTPHEPSNNTPMILAPLNRQPAVAIIPVDNPQHLLPEQEPAGSFPTATPSPHPSANLNIGAFERN